MGKVSETSTYHDPIGVLEELLEHDIALDVLQQMAYMIERKMNSDEFEAHQGDE